jgi:hypothetical protein
MRIDNDRIERQRRAKSDIKLVDHPRRKRCGARQISHHSTHRDVHPTGATMGEIRNKILDCAGKIKQWILRRRWLDPRSGVGADTYYPGTQTGITEYNWGAENHINGATAQADILGIFGREGLDLAARWTTPASSTPTYKGMKMYRNYDGNKSTFGDTSVAATMSNPDTVAALPHSARRMQS